MKNYISRITPSIGTDCIYLFIAFRGFPGGSESKASACNVGVLDSIPGSGRFHGKRNCNPLWYFFVQNSKDRGDWQAIVHGVAKESNMTEQLVNNNNNKHLCFTEQCSAIHKSRRVFQLLRRP